MNWASRKPNERRNTTKNRPKISPSTDKILTRVEKSPPPPFWNTPLVENNIFPLLDASSLVEVVDDSFFTEADFFSVEEDDDDDDDDDVDDDDDDDKEEEAKAFVPLRWFSWKTNQDRGAE